MRRWMKISSLALCLLAGSGLEAGLEAQSSFVAHKGAKRLKVLTDVGFVTITSTSFTNVATTTITVPSGWTSGRIVARFSGESNCNGSAGYCSVRILVDGFEMPNASGFDYAFDDTQGSTWESSSLERTSNELAPGIHTITVQAGLVGGPTSWVIDDYALAVSLWRVN